MRLKNLELNGFKSFAHKTNLEFSHGVVSIVGPNGSGKSNVVEAIRFVLGEQSMKSMRGKAGMDMIFKGSKSLSKGQKASVKIYFDNKDHIFKLADSSGDEINLNFDTVSISREVYPDGVNKYLLNDSEVRLRDINNLLASVNVGASGHHIISQGEADRILNASPRDRREMVEDALGLKVYQYKIKESERKLERATTNMKEVTMLRRENAPHLKFLQKQVEKFEKAKEMKIELLELYRDYLKKESVYIDKEKKEILDNKKELEKKLDHIEGNFKELGSSKEESTDEKAHGEVRDKERKISEIRLNKDELSKKLGRTQAMFEIKESRVKLAGKCPVCGSVVVKKEEDEHEVEELKKAEESIMAEIKSLGEKEEQLRNEIAELLKIIDAEKDKKRFGDVRRLELEMDKNKVLSELNLIRIKDDQLHHAENDFQNEIREGNVLIGSEILSYKDVLFEGEVDRNAQEEERKKIERIKIKLEDVGLGNSAEVMKEYDEVTARDQFLAKEVEDLTVSIESLQVIMKDLKEKIDTEFKEGIKKINVQFKEFFALMFGGGTGTLSVVAENKRKRKENSIDDETGEPIVIEDDGTPPEEGIEIDISLPHKKVKELHALSGGERSLTSIALLFAMSQVNPPPFLVLDETDAALDEANSRKYGDMLEKLSKYSQLVVVTHNRETMSRAGMLYGVTMGSDGASKLLSVKFDEAVTIAK